MLKIKNTLLKSSFVLFLAFTINLIFLQTVFAASAGTITFTTGDTSIIRADKSVIKAAKNDAVNAGDTIETKNGRVQLALIDGGKVSLQPNTVYKINKYEFSGKEDGSEYAFTELVKGGMRTISGLIGHKNRERYQLKTAVATIGIRGTEFTVNFNNNQLLMTTNHGSVDVCNTAGCLNAITGQSIVVVGTGAAPKRSSKVAAALATPPNGKPTVITEKATQALANDSDAITTVNQPSATVAVQTSNDSSQTPSSPITETAVQTFNNSSQTPTAVTAVQTPTNFVQTPENVLALPSTVLAIPTNTVLVSSTTLNSNSGYTSIVMKPFEEVVENFLEVNDFVTNGVNQPTHIYTDDDDDIQLVSFASYSDSDGIVTWGRAVGNITDDLDDVESIDWIDYAVGTKPDPTQLANLTGTYNFNVFASTAPMLVSGDISTVVGNANAVTGNFTYSFAGAGNYNYSLNVNTFTSTYALNGVGSVLSASNPSFQAGGTVTSTACLGGCSAALDGGSTLIQGAFFGLKGQRIGLQYGFNALVGDIYGTAVLK